MPAAAESRVLMGAVTKAHGIRGEVMVKWFGDDPEDIGRYETFEDEQGSRTYTVVRAKPHKADMAIVQFADVRDRNAAEALRGVRLFVDRARLAPAGKDKFYLVDLIGLDAVDDAGRKVGEVVAMHNFGAGDVMEIARQDGGDTVMVPFTHAFVPEVAPGRHVVVHLPEEEAAT